MRIVVSESQALKELVFGLLQVDDPDYPMHRTSGLSITLNRKVQRVLAAAMTEQTFFADPLIEYHVDQIRRDPLIIHLLTIPWTDFNVVDNEGTIAFII